MRLYELNALVDFATTNRDTAIEQFFFEDHTERTRFPATLGGLTNLTLRDEPRGALSLTTIVYLGSPEHMLLAQKLFDDTVADLNAVAYQPYVAPLEGTEHAGLVGPLWLRDATLNIIGKGDGYFSPGKEAWAGWLLTSDGPEDVDRQYARRHETQQRDDVTSSRLRGGARAAKPPAAALQRPEVHALLPHARAVHPRHQLPHRGV